MTEYMTIKVETYNKMAERLTYLEQKYAGIVRCKDCEYYDKGDNEVDSWEMCKRNLHSTSQYDFCSWAKMKGDINP